MSSGQELWGIVLFRRFLLRGNQHVNCIASPAIALAASSIAAAKAGVSIAKHIAPKRICRLVSQGRSSARPPPLSALQLCTSSSKIPAVLRRGQKKARVVGRYAVDDREPGLDRGARTTGGERCGE
jgi:hypothetical protein